MSTPADILDGLTPRQQHAAAMYWHDGMRTQQIGAVLGISQMAAWYLIDRARRNLARVGVIVERVPRPARPRRCRYSPEMDAYLLALARRCRDDADA